MKPHKYAEFIKAWADGATIEFYVGNAQWQACDGTPSWMATKYRIKPAAPVVEYPVTRMTNRELVAPWAESPVHETGLRAVANAALRHAIDSQQVVSMAEVQEIASELSKRMRAARELAVAEAVRTACMNGRYAIQGRDDMDLAAIIAKVR